MGPSAHAMGSRLSALPRVDGSQSPVDAGRKGARCGLWRANRWGGWGLRGPAEVAVVQAADFWNLHDLARRGALDGPEVGCVLVEREMGARLMVISEVTGQDSTQVSFAEDKNVVETLAADRTDQALGERILPGAVWRRENFLDLHPLHAVAELLAIDLVTVAQEVGRRGVVRERVHDLLGGPEGGGMLGDVEVDDAPAMVGEHDEDEQDAQARGGHGEEIDGDQVADMVGEEGPPGLRRRGDAVSASGGTRCARPRRYRASGARHGCAGRPTAGSRWPCG